MNRQKPEEGCKELLEGILYICPVPLEDCSTLKASISFNVHEIEKPNLAYFGLWT